MSLSAEVRRQKDEVNEGSYNYDGVAVGIQLKCAMLAANLQVHMPRFIADFKPNEDTTIYLSYAEGVLAWFVQPGVDWAK